MIIEITEKENCADCVFCEEMIYCNLRDGEHIEFEDDYSKAVSSFCPLRNQTVKITDKVKIITQ